ncbi:hypothetical protein [Aureibacillus halotolerans]|uniref:Uncharacterized protein n=1 Tax=Aureibacillus halotolerans TaxID=1508390 RepID=A0A4R6U893_9BACI|nr:hypothetical protein [Aureibacillus halotolerans]TDQ42790.1 hypothetical protein EV213_101219 [Aureibacillus halotolerans]
MRYQELVEKPLVEQEHHIREWRETMKTAEIIEMLGCPYYKLYAMMKKLGIPLREKKHTKRTVPVEEEQMESYRKETIPYTRFQLLPVHQKNELIQLYLNQNSAQELAQLWDVSTATVYNQRRKIEQADRKLNGSFSNGQGQKQQNNLSTDVEKTLALLQKRTTHSSVDSKSILPAYRFNHEQENEDRLAFNVTGTFTSSEIIDKLKALYPFIEDRGKKYKLSVQIFETTEDSDTSPNSQSSAHKDLYSEESFYSTDEEEEENQDYTKKEAEPASNYS